MKTVSYKLLGLLSLCLGIIGAFLPVMPTTCFVLLAAWCFAKSSPKWHQHLLNSPLFGETIKQWEAHRYIPPKARFCAIGSMLAFGGISLTFIDSMPLQILLLILIGIGIYSVQYFKQRQLT